MIFRQSITQRLYILTTVALLITINHTHSAVVRQQPKKQVAQQFTEAQRLAMEGIQAFDTKEFQKAITLFRKALRLDPQNADYQYEIALAYSLLDKPDSAIAILQTLVEHPKASEAYYRLYGNLYAEKNDTAKAMAVFRSGIKRFPRSGVLRMETGLLLLQAKKLDEALDEFEEGIQTNPEFLHNYYWAARAYKGTNEKIWSLLYAELYCGLDNNPKRQADMSMLMYETYRLLFDDFEKNGVMNSSKAIVGEAGGTPTHTPKRASFEDRFDDALTAGAKPLKFFRDFELPISGIDTIRTVAIQQWNSNGLQKEFPNAVFAYQEKVFAKGYMRPYTYHIMRFAKPLEFESYYKANKSEYEAFVAWQKNNPMTVQPQTLFSRFRYN
ncbi:MAG: tetratricopeptide repeat protein [Candidatus Kapabacteria bacterium]|nr:tetratricopeptide repeat protein [Candidatus Kapabacteria bacterium]